MITLLYLVILAAAAAVVIQIYKQSSKIALKCTFKKQTANGILFGKRNFLLFYSPSTAEGHIFVCGGSGTGKTSAILIPSLRRWDGTSFTIDISGDISSNVPCPRKMVYDPADTTTIPYNIFAPIDALTNDSDRIEALAQLAYLIMPELQNSSANADYFQNGGRAILTAALIWGYHAGLDFIEICHQISDQSYFELFNKIDSSKDAEAIRFISQFEGNSEQNTAGCKQNADRAISLFSTNARVQNSIRRPAIGETAFSCSSVEDHNVFVVIPDARLELFSPLLHIITAQVLNYLADRPADQSTPILLSLDEFVSLGKLDIAPSLRKLRKKHVRIMVLTQSIADLDAVYSTNYRKSMMNNFAFKVILSASDTDSQRYFSDLIGKEDTEKQSSFTTKKVVSQRYIIEPAELAHLGHDLILLHPDGYKRLAKNFYFKN